MTSQVGFDASNDNLYYAWSTSRTAAVANIDDGSNVGLTGRYLFRVDGTTVDDYSASSVGKPDVSCSRRQLFTSVRRRLQPTTSAVCVCKTAVFG